MTTDNLSTLKIYKLTEKQYKRRLEAGEIDENAFYFTDDKSGDGALVYNVVGKGQMLSGSMWPSICYGNGMFVAVDGDACYGAVYSTDGINWKQCSGIDPDMCWSSVCYGNGKFVAICGGNIVYSTDGINWEESYSFTDVGIDDGGWHSVCYGDGKFVAIGSGLYGPAYSEDGINWEYNSDLDNNDGWKSVCYGDGKFVIVGEDGVLLVSTDGINWNIDQMPFGTIWGSVCYGNGKFVAADFDGYGNCGAVYSTDGINWEYSNGLNEDACWRVFYANDKFIALGGWGTYTVSEIAISYDGISWATVTTFEEPLPLHSVCYGDGKYVAVGESAEALISLDGINWSVKNYVSQNGKDVTEELREVLGGGGAGGLVVTIDENDNVSHTVEQIYNHVANGGNVVLYYDDNYWHLDNINETLAIFVYTEPDTSIIRKVEYTNDTVSTYWVRYADANEIETLVVTINESKASHNSSTIYDEVQIRGRNVVLKYDNRYWHLDSVTVSDAIFMRHEPDTTVCYKASIGSDKHVDFYTYDIASMISSAIGDAIGGSY